MKLQVSASPAGYGQGTFIVEMEYLVPRLQRFFHKCCCHQNSDRQSAYFSVENLRGCAGGKSWIEKLVGKLPIIHTNTHSHNTHANFLDLLAELLFRVGNKPHWRQDDRKSGAQRQRISFIKGRKKKCSSSKCSGQIARVDF